MRSGCTDWTVRTSWCIAFVGRLEDRIEVFHKRFSDILDDLDLVGSVTPRSFMRVPFGTKSVAHPRNGLSQPIPTIGHSIATHEFVEARALGASSLIRDAQRMH